MLVGSAADCAIGRASVSVTGSGSKFPVDKARSFTFREQFIYIILYFIIFGSQSMQ